MKLHIRLVMKTNKKWRDLLPRNANRNSLFPKCLKCRCLIAQLQVYF